MDNLQLLIDLHRDMPRQGPGSRATTEQALALSGLAGHGGQRIADIGCGSGAATLMLAEALDADVVGVDMVPAFLARLREEAHQAQLSHRVTSREERMDALTFDDGSLDGIWSEGAIYNMGFAAGVREWRRFLKPGAVLAVSEITWLGTERPAELNDFWQQNYPEIDTAGAKIRVLEDSGYTPMGYFVLPSHCWLDSYYQPLRDRFAPFLQRHHGSPLQDAARAIISATEQEIDFFERYQTHYSYGFYLARRA